MSKSQSKRSKTQVKPPVKRLVPGKRIVMPVRARSVKKAMPKKAKSAPNSAAVGRFLASSVAGLVPGGSAFSGLAGQVGGWLGDKIGTALGLGEYRVNQNTVIGEGVSPPVMHNDDDMIVVRHREYLGDVFSSATPGAFSVVNYPINPGLSVSFPWCSISAVAYREWTPLGMLYEFKSNTGFVSNSTTPAVGMVIMATDYNSFDTDPFANKLEMENNMYTTSARSTESFYHPIECKSERNVLGKFFLRAGEIPDNQPPQLYDLGTFSIASVGQPTANQNLGELWCTVELGFSKATLQNRHDNESSTDMWAFNGCTDGTPLAGTITYPATSTLGGSLVSGTTYNFPPTRVDGDFVFLYYNSAVVATGTPGWLANPIFTNCLNETAEWQAAAGVPAANTNICGTSVVFGSGPTTVSGDNFCALIMKIRVTGRNASVTLNTGPGPNWTANGFLLVTPVAHGVEYLSNMFGEHYGIPRGVGLSQPPEGMSMRAVGSSSDHSHCVASPNKTRDLEDFYAIYKAFNDKRAAPTETTTTA